MCILPSGALGLEQDLSGHRPRSAWACVTIRLHGGGAREDVRRSAQPLFAGCDPGWCFGGLPVRRAFARNSALREAATGVRGRPGQPRPYVRPAARHLPLAIMGVRMRVRRQAVWRARGTRLSSAFAQNCSTCSPSHHAVQRLPPDRAGSRPPPTRRARASRRCRSRRDAAPRAVDLVARHHRPGDARHLVGQGHRHLPNRTPLQQPSHPRPRGAVPLPGAVHH